MQIPLSRPDISEEDIKAVVAVLNTPYLALGPKLRGFEERLAEYVGVKYAIAVNSGTSGLHLVMRALNIGTGDEVITTPFSFIASANCILYEGAKPVFVDIEPKTLAIDPAKVEKAITKRTKAILGVDVFGHPADWAALRRIANRHGLYLIEDAAEALGTRVKVEVKGRKGQSGFSQPVRFAGSFGDVGVFSFYPNKQITTGEGGAVVTNNKRIAEMCESLRNQGRGKMQGEWNWLSHIRLGYNYRVSEITCALGISQLSRIEEIIAKRARVAGFYNEKLKELPEIETPYVAPNVRMSWFVYVVRLRKGVQNLPLRDKVLVFLRENGIGCSNYFPPIHLQPFYRKEFGYKRGDFPICEDVSRRTIALPFYNNLTEEEIDYVVMKLKESLGYSI